MCFQVGCLLFLWLVTIGSALGYSVQERQHVYVHRGVQRVEFNLEAEGSPTALQLCVEYYRNTTWDAGSMPGSDNATLTYDGCVVTKVLPAAGNQTCSCVVLNPCKNVWGQSSIDRSLLKVRAEIGRFSRSHAYVALSGTRWNWRKDHKSDRASSSSSSKDEEDTAEEKRKDVVESGSIVENDTHLIYPLSEGPPLPLSIPCPHKWPCITAVEGLESSYYKLQQEVLSRDVVVGNGAEKEEVYISILRQVAACGSSSLQRHEGELQLVKFPDDKDLKAVLRLSDVQPLRTLRRQDGPRGPGDSDRYRAYVANWDRDYWHSVLHVPKGALLPAPFHFATDVRICVTLEGSDVREIQPNWTNFVRLEFGTYSYWMEFTSSRWKRQVCCSRRLWEIMKKLPAASGEPLSRVGVAIRQFEGRGRVHVSVMGTAEFRANKTTFPPTHRARTFACWGRLPCAEGGESLQLQHHTFRLDNLIGGNDLYGTISYLPAAETLPGACSEDDIVEVAAEVDVGDGPTDGTTTILAVVPPQPLSCPSQGGKAAEGESSVVVNQQKSIHLQPSCDGRVEFNFDERELSSRGGLHPPVRVCVQYSFPGSLCGGDGRDRIYRFYEGYSTPVDRFLPRPFFQGDNRYLSCSQLGVSEMNPADGATVQKIVVTLGRYTEGLAKVTASGALIHWRPGGGVKANTSLPLAIVCPGSPHCVTDVRPPTGDEEGECGYVVSHQLLQPVKHVNCDRVLVSLIESERCENLITQTGSELQLIGVRERAVLMFSAEQQATTRAKSSSMITGGGPVTRSRRRRLKSRIQISKEDLPIYPFHLLIPVTVCFGIRRTDDGWLPESKQLSRIGLRFGESHVHRIEIRLVPAESHFCYTRRLWDILREAPGRRIEPLSEIYVRLGQFVGRGNYSMQVNATGSSIFSQGGQGKRILRSKPYPAAIFCWGDAPCAESAYAGTTRLRLEHETLSFTDGRGVFSGYGENSRNLTVSFVTPRVGEFQYYRGPVRFVVPGET